MGNCLRYQSSTQWAGDDRGTSPANDEDEGLFCGQTTHDTFEYSSVVKMEEKGLLGNHQKDNVFTTSSATTTEVKVKITKKQLEKLLAGVDVKELSVQQVLTQLITVSNQCNADQRSWRPTLQSIPEVN